VSVFPRFGAVGLNGEEGTYVIAAGKTGGHIFPGLALAREIRARRPTASILFVGTPGGLETRLVPEAGFPLEFVRASGFIGKSAGQRVRSLVWLPIGFFQARRILKRHRARAVAGMGGYVSLPVVGAARSLGIAAIVHDSDALPGVANRLLNSIGTRTAVGWEAANSRLSRPGIVTGTPVRPEFLRVPPLAPGAATRRVLVFGGSQGSVALNRAIAAAAPRLSREGVEVLHQTGEKNLAAARALYGVLPPGWRLEPFLPRLYDDLAWADLVVSRAGATTLAELAAAGRPAVLVPFGSAANAHQLANALAFSEGGAARVLEEPQLSGDSLAEAVVELLSDRVRLLEMGRRARELAHPDAARQLTDLLFQAEAER
jgi:UDP-N-acetylglucosamine--N-acetylmuramyl-(pentapeptide) pyrophosphoryl-undecaprenol N-acetylglucosamine transferase